MQAPKETEVTPPLTTHGGEHLNRQPTGHVVVFLFDLIGFASFDSKKKKVKVNALVLLLPCR